MEKLVLMEHHLSNIKYNVEVNEKKSRFDRWVYDGMYGEGSFDKESQWAKSLDLDNTLVKIIPDKNPLTGGLNMDSLCKRGCFYVEDCRKSPWRTMLSVLKAKPSIFPFVFFKGLYIGIKNRKESDKFVIGEEYTLREIVESPN